jgi:hypothetical protein
MKCMVCGCWVEIEEPNPTDLGFFMCDDCIEDEADELEPSVIPGES